MVPQCGMRMLGYLFDPHRKKKKNNLWRETVFARAVMFMHFASGRGHQCRMTFQRMDTIPCTHTFKNKELFVCTQALVYTHSLPFYLLLYDLCAVGISWLMFCSGQFD